MFIKAETLAPPTAHGNAIFNPYINATAQDEFRMLSDYSAENKTADLYYYKPNNKELDTYMSLSFCISDHYIIDRNTYYSLFTRHSDMGNNISACLITTISNEAIITDISSLALKYLGIDSDSVNYITDYISNNDMTLTVTCSNGKSLTIDPCTLKITE